MRPEQHSPRDYFSVVTKPAECCFTFASRPMTSCLPEDGWRRPKRCRPLADVDGHPSSQARPKKRRLRRYLITSRLSRPFSAPPTHIINRGSSRIAIWAKRHASGRILLRKAAIMNHIRHTRRVSCPSREIRRRSSPSPLGLSNYDALDREDESDEQGGEGEMWYSDLNLLQSTPGPMRPIVVNNDDDDDVDVLDLACPNPPKYRPPSPLDEHEHEVDDVGWIRFGDLS